MKPEERDAVREVQAEVQCWAKRHGGNYGQAWTLLWDRLWVKTGFDARHVAWLSGQDELGAAEGAGLLEGLRDIAREVLA